MTAEPAHRILVVDDEPDITALVAYHLAKVGYRVTTAASGRDALAAAREERPDLVVLDLMLPKLPGYEVLRELRKHRETAKIPVMVVSSLPQSNDQKLLDEGATSYFEKAGLMLDQGADLFVQNVRKMLSQSKAAAIR